MADTPARHPIQPLAKDSQGVMRFKQNAIVRYLLDSGPFDLNQLARMEFSDADREQFAQLIGTSLGKFSELSYVSDETYDRAATVAGWTLPATRKITQEWVTTLRNASCCQAHNEALSVMADALELYLRPPE